MDYRQAVAFLEELTRFGINLGLHRMTRLLELLGNPHRHLHFVHIAGTNGKGSTAVMLDAVLQAAGYRVGLYTSPHLHEYPERFRIDGEEMSQAEMVAYIQELRPYLEEMVAAGGEQPTEFEVLTAVAALYFYRRGVDMVVWETGLGGSIDSTNVVTPEVSIITSIGMDHMAYLGSTIADIARAKAGIIKAGVPVVTAVEQPEALDVIAAACRENQAPWWQVGREIHVEVQTGAPDGLHLNIHLPGRDFPDLFLPLIGRHQARNAACALGALDFLARRGFAWPRDAVYTGLAGLEVPGRQELFSGPPRVLLDVGHNAEAAAALRQVLLEELSYRHLVLVLGILADKEREKIVDLLAPLAKTVVVCRPESPRAGDWEQVGVMAARYAAHVFRRAAIEDAVQLALELAGPEDLICISGSFYLVGEARSWLKKFWIGKKDSVKN